MLSITYSECVFVASGIQHVMYCVILSSMACPALSWFFFRIMSQRAQFSKRKTILDKNVNFDFYITFLWNISRIQRGSTVNARRFHVKCTLFFSDFNQTWIFSDKLSQNIQISNFMKSIHWESNCYITTKRQTWHDETRVAFFTILPTRLTNSSYTYDKCQKYENRLHKYIRFIR